MKSFFYKSKKITLFLLFCIFGSAQANTLQDILQSTLVNDPVLLEAEADKKAAGNRVKQNRALHYPTARVKAASTLFDKYKDDKDKKDRFQPQLEVAVNVYSFGAISSKVKESEAKKGFYEYKYSETKEELAYTVSDLYLTALNAKNAIQVLKKSLSRHQSFLKEISTIVEYDQGRNSEYVQAQARKILVEQRINNKQQLLESTLSSLAKYTKQPIKESQLNNPFNGITRKDLTSKYSSAGHDKNPSYLAQKAELESKQYELDAERAKRLPSIDLVGTLDKDERKVNLQLSWDILNQRKGYEIEEKENLKSAASSRLDRISRDLEESARLAIINMKRSRIQLGILKKQIRANAKVAKLYRLQFDVALKTILDVLNAESELSDVELAYVETRGSLNKAILDYLRSQGKISDWAMMK